MASSTIITNVDRRVLCRILIGKKSFNYVIDQNSRIDLIKDLIRQRFKIHEFELSYSIPDHDGTSMLDCDMDLNLLVEFAKLCKSDYVDIDVSVASDVVSGSTLSGSTGTSLDIVSPDSVASITNPVDIHLDEVEAYGRFLPVEGVSFVSGVWKTLIQSEGQTFLGGVDEFRTKLRKFAIESGFKLIMPRNTLNRVSGFCGNECVHGQCSWKVYGVKVIHSNFFQIKKFVDIHTCTGRIRSNRSQLVNSRLVSSIILPKVKLNQNIAPKDIIRDMNLDYGIKIDYHLAWYSRELARNKINGHEGVGYSKLAWYVDSLKASNPGSACILEVYESRFKRLFVCYDACIQGFQYCRPLLFIDATHIKNKFKGVLLCATGKNANQGFYPFAFAIVSAENQENWLWFFEKLRGVLLPSERVMNFITDRNEGLIKAISFIFPDAYHAYCYYHLTLNLKTKFPVSYPKEKREKILKRFMKLTYTPSTEAFYYHLQKLIELGGNPIASFMKNLPKEKFSNAFFGGCRFGDVSNGIAESFNSWILELRHLPIFEIVEGIRKKLMEQFANRKLEAEAWTTTLCPDVITQINKSLNIGGQWKIWRSGMWVFEVSSDYTLRVDLQLCQCSCGMWRVKRFPCAHALVAIQQIQGDFSDYIEDYLKSSYFKAAYALPIEPVPDIDKDFEDRGDVELMPPQTRVPPGRPVKKRIRSQGENCAKMYKCSRCRGVGHNRSGCTAAI